MTIEKELKLIPYFSALGLTVFLCFFSVSAGSALVIVLNVFLLEMMVPLLLLKPKFSWAEMAHVWKTAFGENRDQNELEKALAYFRILRRSFFVFLCLWIFAALVNSVFNPPAISLAPLNESLILVGILFSLSTLIFFLNPLRIALERRLFQ